jgi:hypothetical protein
MPNYTASVMDSRGNFVPVASLTPIVVNGTFTIPKPEIVGKNPAYKSIHSTSIILPLK